MRLGNAGEPANYKIFNNHRHARRIYAIANEAVSFSFFYFADEREHNMVLALFWLGWISFFSSERVAF